MADKKNPQAAPDADPGAQTAATAPDAMPITGVAPDGALAAPQSSADRVAPVTAPDDLNPMDMDGRGQSLSPVEQAQADAILARERAKAEAAEMVRQAEADALEAQRQRVQEDQERRRKEAVKQAEESRAAIFETRGRLQSVAVDPVSLALEAAHSSAMAAALQIDETVPGGYYVVAGRVQDANGADLGPAPRD